MCSEQLLGSDSAKCGQYEIRYRRKQFRKAEKGSADLVMKVFSEDKDNKELYRTPIHFNVPDDYELNIALQDAEYKGPSEWEVVTAELTPLLEDVAPQDLREDDQFQDISFLAGESGRTPLALAVWAACFHLAQKTSREKTPLPPEVFFGFMRQGQPSIFNDTLLQDMRFPDRRALLEDKILRGLAEIAPTLQQSILERALADNLVPARTRAILASTLATLAQIKLRYAAEVSFGGGKGTIGELLALTPAAKQQQAAFMAAFTAHTGPLGDFWKKLTEDKVLPPDVIQQVKLSFEIGALARNHIPLVAELLRRIKAGTVRDPRELARYDRAQWKAIFALPGPDGNPIDVPANIDGDTPDKKRETFAAILEQQFERSFPTAAFAGKLGNGLRLHLTAGATGARGTARLAAGAGVHAAAAAAPSTDLVRFFSNNPTFQRFRTRSRSWTSTAPRTCPSVSMGTSTD